MNQQAIVQEETEGAGHGVPGKMKAERQHGFCPPTHQQGNTKGRKKRTTKIINHGSIRKKDSK